MTMCGSSSLSYSRSQKQTGNKFIKEYSNFSTTKLMKIVQKNQPFSEESHIRITKRLCYKADLFSCFFDLKKKLRSIITEANISSNLNG